MVTIVFLVPRTGSGPKGGGIYVCMRASRVSRRLCLGDFWLFTTESAPPTPVRQDEHTVRAHIISFRQCFLVSSQRKDANRKRTEWQENLMFGLKELGCLRVTGSTLNWLCFFHRIGMTLKFLF